MDSNTTATTVKCTCNHCRHDANNAVSPQQIAEQLVASLGGNNQNAVVSIAMELKTPVVEQPTVVPEPLVEQPTVVPEPIVEQPEPVIEQPEPAVNPALAKIEQLRAEAARRPVEVITDITVTKLEWQQTVFDSFKETNANINWVIGSGIGKTNFCKYHCGNAIALRRPEDLWGYLKASSDPVLNPRTYKDDSVEGRPFVFDLVNGSEIDYDMLFAIKDGFISSTTTGPRQFTSPAVWVLANTEPLLWQSRTNKIVQWTVVDNKLVKRT